MVTVKFFASFREKVGKSEIKLSTKGEVTLQSVIDTLEKKIPGLKKLIEEGNAAVALNEEIAAENAVVKESDEIAIFPPVSGGEDMIKIQREDFSIEEEIKKVKARSARIGGVVAFLGTAREFSRGKEIKKLVYEHYAAMAQKKLEELRERAMKNFEVIEIAIIHRTGEIKIGENIVLIIAAAEHRSEAFKACQWCIDELKRAVPIWKKEITSNGEVWVEEHA